MLVNQTQTQRGSVWNPGLNLKVKNCNPVRQWRVRKEYREYVSGSNNKNCGLHNHRKSSCIKSSSFLFILLFISRINELERKDECNDSTSKILSTLRRRVLTEAWICLSIYLFPSSARRIKVHRKNIFDALQVARKIYQNFGLWTKTNVCKAEKRRY